MDPTAASHTLLQAGTLALITAIAGGSVGAQSLDVTNPVPGVSHATEPDVDVWRLRGVAELPIEARIALSQSSEPIWYKVADPKGKALREIVDATCGEQPDQVTEYLRQQAVSMNGVESLDTFIEAEEVAAIPFCLQVERNVTVEVNLGDTPSGILAREYGVYGPKTVMEMYALNADSYHTSFEKFERNLRPGEEVIVPFRAPERVYVQRADAETNVAEIVATLPNESVRAQVLTSFKSTTGVVDREPFRLRYVQSVVFSDADPAAACNGESGQLAEIVDRPTLAARFAAEAAAKTKFWQAEPTMIGVTSTQIGIIDTGLRRVGDDFFDPRFFVANVRELNGGPNVDNDGNGHKGDVYGTNFYARSGVIEPLETDRDRSHGTKMATLILGGLDIAQDWLLQFELPVIRLKVVNFSNSLPFSPTVSTDMLPAAITYLHKQGARVINLSLATEEKIVAVKNVFRNMDDVLFIVAAGNATDGEGRDLRRPPPLFPARYGGERGNPNVITVAAHDLSGRRATFSNFSAKYVDLLAPGCAVPTRTDEGNIVLDNGTSPATAIVSFAAGLIHALGLSDPSDIKERLLVGTDHDTKLEVDAFSTGRLNIIKAISLYHDVIEMAEPGVPPIFGNLRSPEAVFQACSDPTIAPEPTSLRKVIPNLETDNGTHLEYWVEVDDVLEQLQCRQTDANVGLHLDSVGEGESNGLALASVKEIVFGKFVTR